MKKVQPQQSLSHEEMDWLPYGLLQSAGDGLEACLYCQHYASNPGFSCRPLCCCNLHQGLIPNEKVSSVVCGHWQPLHVA